jgi:methyl-accepting chemotaxis protein
MTKRGSALGNISLKTKIIISGVTAEIAALVLTAIISFLGLQTNARYQTDLVQLAYEFNLAQRISMDYSKLHSFTLQALLFWENESIREAQIANIETFTARLESEIAELDETLAPLSGRSVSINKIKGYLIKLTFFLANVKALSTGSNENFIMELEENISEPMDLNVIDAFADLVGEISSVAVRNQIMFDKGIFWSLVAAGSFFIVAFAFTLAIVKDVSAPLKELAIASERVIKGDFTSVRSSDRKDEIGVIMNKFYAVTEVVYAMINDISVMTAEQMRKGNIDYYLDDSKYEGKYGAMVKQINNLSRSFFSDTKNIVKALDSFARGNFNVDFNPLPGKKAVINKTIDKLELNLKMVSADIDSLISAALEGYLEVRADLGKHEGDWKRIISRLNKLIDAITEPIQEVKEVVSVASRGNLGKKVEGEYKGEFNEFKNSVNYMIDELKKYVYNISEVLSELAKDNYDVKVGINYIGDFKPIKSALNSIVERINAIMINIKANTEQIAAGSKMLSESSMEMSEGAMRQAAAIEEISASMTMILKQTEHMYDLSKSANKLSGDISVRARDGSIKMELMLNSMGEITETSRSISNLMHIIEDIAFQTNRLALKASAEASRAGRHGIGFASVADEIRGLAVRAQEASYETNDLLEIALRKVDDGNLIASETSSAFGQIVDGIMEITGLISNIAKDSEAQNGSIHQVNGALNQITEVTQDNTATSEETAASSEELSAQAEVFRTMVSEFRLRE